MEKLKLHSLDFGKVCEYRVASNLIKAGFDVFQSVVDRKGVDFVIKNKFGSYFDIQVKGRQSRNIFTVKNFQSSKNYYFILIDNADREHLISSLVIKEWLSRGRKFSFTKLRQSMCRDTYLTLHKIKQID